MRDVRAALIVVLAAGVAHADPKPEKIDLSAQIDKLEVYRDEVGNYYVVPKQGAFEKREDAEPWVFYGDGKTLYRQRVLGYGEHKGRQWSLWAPRAIGIRAAVIDVDDKATIACKNVDHGSPARPLTRLAADEAHSLLAKAKVLSELHQRVPHLLARDDDGAYYYIDELRSGNGYRLFIGLKGAMKEVPLTNIVSDSAGELFATKSGSIKVPGKHDAQTYWVKGDKKIELTTVLDLAKDHYLIYRELGIYGPLGAVCEDM